MYSKSKQVSLAAPKLGPVTLALQLQSGDRLIAEFRPEGDCLNYYILLLHAKFFSAVFFKFRSGVF